MAHCLGLEIERGRERKRENDGIEFRAGLLIRWVVDGQGGWVGTAACGRNFLGVGCEWKFGMYTGRGFELLSGGRFGCVVFYHCEGE